jgi:hypothetical protein
VHGVHGVMIGYNVTCARIYRTAAAAPYVAPLSHRLLWEYWYYCGYLRCEVGITVTPPDSYGSIIAVLSDLRAF